MHQSLTRKVVVITGASGGLGRALARQFGREGAAVALIARDPGRLEAARAEIEDLGGTAAVYPLDVSDADAVDAVASRIEDELGPIDIWVNNAMATIFAPFHEIQPGEFARATDVTYLGTVWGTHSALARMRARDRGTIIQVGSAIAYRGIPLQSPYSGAKHAIRGFTDALRAELLHERSGIKLCIAHLPAMNTPQFLWGRSRMPKMPQPVAPIFQPEVAARAIVGLARRPHRERWVGAMTGVVIVGNKLLPSLGDWYLAQTGFDGQQTDTDAPSGRPDNLFTTVPSDIAAHGSFDAQAHTRSPQSWLAQHRRGIARAVLGAGLLAAGTTGAVRRWSEAR